MLKIDNEKLILVGSKGTIDLNVDDEIILKFSMLFEGECEGFGASLSAKKFGYTRQRYYQLLQKLQNEGIEALKSKKTGPQTNYRAYAQTIHSLILQGFAGIIPKIIL
jgi:DNA invertase Pin-like site-specific DNA recombinase